MQAPGTANGVMATHHLKRDIAVILAIKLGIVLAAALFVFGPGQRPHIDRDTMRNQILSKTLSYGNDGSLAR
jgi:hypothetical protein